MRKGFSLVELSIVLVTLGLLTGGILGGQSLIHASELRTISTQYANYITATQAFRDKYFALPGDVTNASQFWQQAAAGAACGTTPSTGAATCDGDGDNMIENSAFSTGPHVSDEQLRFWQHLSNAGLIEGTYDGVSAMNRPLGKMPSTYWSTQWLGNVIFLMGFTPAKKFDGDYGHAFTFAGTDRLMPEDVWNIDSKMDDGKPATGKTVVQVSTSQIMDDLTICTSTNNQTDMAANYAVSATGAGCGIIYRRLF